MVTKYPIFFHRRFGHVDVTVSDHGLSPCRGRVLGSACPRRRDAAWAGRERCIRRGVVCRVLLRERVGRRRVDVFRDGVSMFSFFVMIACGFTLCASRRRSDFICGRDDRDRSRSTDDAYRACFWSKLD